MKILIKNTFLDKRKVDILIEDRYIKAVSPTITEVVDEVIDGSYTAVLPSFINAHTHAAMTILRGYADDMELMEWLQNKIWPLEAKLTEEDIYWGTKFACLEMIKTGTSSFVDMYWQMPGVLKAVNEMGLKALISSVFLDMNNPDQTELFIKQSEELYKSMDKYNDRVRYCLGPHAIYTVSEEGLLWIRDFASKNNIPITIHLSETLTEVEECLSRHGCRPVEYLERLRFLGPDVIVAHCVHLSDKEIDILKKNRVTVAHLPASNMKLCSGVLPFKRLIDAGVDVALGTDGCSSNNSLDMIEEMKIMALLHKNDSGLPQVAGAEEVFSAAFKPLSGTFFPETGSIEKGKRADLILIDLNHHLMIPNHSLISNLVYSGTGNIVKTMLCDGKILMKDRFVEEEEDIKTNFLRIIRKLFPDYTK